jgi:hypothetical protein
VVPALVPAVVGHPAQHVAGLATPAISVCSSVALRRRPRMMSTHRKATGVKIAPRRTMASSIHVATTAT